MPLGVTVDFNANLVRFEEQLNRAAGNLDRFQGHVEGMSSGVNKALGALGIGVSLAGIGAFVKEGIDAADAMNDVADRTGMAIETIAGLDWVTHLADTSVDAFSKSVNKLSLFLAKNGDEMKKLGVTAKEPYEAFLQFADVYSSIEDNQRRAALGNAVLGKSYAEMAPLLLMGSDGIRKNVDEGQRMNGITAEMAKTAGEFNDRLDNLTARLHSLTAVVAGPILPGLTNFAERMEYAMRKAQGLKDVVSGDFLDNLKAGSDFGAAINQIKEIDGLIDAQKAKIERIRKHNVLAFIGNYDIGEEERKLNILIDRRANAVKQRSINISPKVSVTPDIKIDDSTVDKIMKLGDDGDKAAKKAESAAESLAKKYEDTIAGMQREIALRGDNTEVAKMEYEVISGSFSSLAEGQKLKLLNLAAEKDGIALNIKAYEEYDQVIADGVELAKKQRTDMAADFDRLNQKFNGPLLDLNKGIADAMDARAQGIIPNDEKLKIELDKMGKEYNRLTSNAEDATGQMSQFAVQGAHNMQTAFADFLFDPFQNGIEGMGANFVKILQRMVAEATSAQIFNALLGKNYGTDNATGGLLQAGFAGISSLFGGFFDSGGVSVSAGNSEAFSSAMNSSSFWSGPSFAGGGNHAGGFRLVGENGPELEYTGPSHIFNADQTRAMLNPQYSNSSNISITTQVNVTTSSSNGDNSNMQALGSVINTRIKQVIVEEKRPGGLLA